MYVDPGYSVFNWRGEEGIHPRGTAGRAAATGDGGHSWEQQRNAAMEQRARVAAAEEAKRTKELEEAKKRSEQYNTATQGVGPSAYLPQEAKLDDPKSLYADVMPSTISY